MATLEEIGPLFSGLETKILDQIDSKVSGLESKIMALALMFMLTWGIIYIVYKKGKHSLDLLIAATPLASLLSMTIPVVEEGTVNQSRAARH